MILGVAVYVAMRRLLRGTWSYEQLGWVLPTRRLYYEPGDTLRVQEVRYKPMTALRLNHIEEGIR